MKSETHAVRRRLTVPEAKKWLASILDEKKKISFDPHTTVYSYLIGIDPAKLEDEKFITSVILSSIVQARMRLMSFSLTKFKGGGGGITAVAVVSDSHIIVNTFPETTSLILDVYACSGSPINVLYEFVRRFKPKRYDFVVFPRIFEERTEVLLSSTGDPHLDKWLRSKNMLPLNNVSEESMIIFNFFGWVKSFGKFEDNKLEISLKDKLLLEVLKEKLKKIGIKSYLSYENDTFKLEIKNKSFIEFIKVLDRKKIFKKLKKSSKSLLASFLAPVLYKAISKSFINDRVLVMEKNEYLSALRKFNFDLRPSKEGFTIKLSKENLMRIQAILSLNKIHPLGMFDPTIETFPVYKMYEKGETFYKIIDYLIEKKSVKKKELIKKIKSKNTSKWIKKLAFHGIIKKNGSLIQLALTI